MRTDPDLDPRDEEPDDDRVLELRDRIDRERRTREMLEPTEGS